MSIEGIALENFSALKNADIHTTTPSHQRHEVFHYFLSDNRKQDAVTTNAHSKRFIDRLKFEKILTT